MASLVVKSPKLIALTLLLTNRPARVLWGAASLLTTVLPVNWMRPLVLTIWMPRSTRVLMLVRPWKLTLDPFAERIGRSRRMGHLRCEWRRCRGWRGFLCD